MQMKLTAVFEKSPYGFIGYVEELTGANSQGSTIEETKENLKEAIELIISVNREIANENLKGKNFTKEEIGTILI